MMHSASMSNELARLEAERDRLIDMALADERRRHFTASVLTAVVVVVIGLVALLLVSAIWADQLSAVGMFGAALSAALLYFILSRKLPGSMQEAIIADAVFLSPPNRSSDPIRAKVNELEAQIARLKAGGA